jgi:hypothetical protein
MYECTEVPPEGNWKRKACAESQEVLLEAVKDYDESHEVWSLKTKLFISNQII